MVLLEKKEGGRARWADAIGALMGVTGRARWADAIEARPTLGGGKCRSGAPFAISRSALQSLLRRRIAHERGAQSI